MKKFLSRHAKKVIGVLSGFDRVVFRGVLRQLAYLSGMSAFLFYKKILLKDAKQYFQETTARIKSESLRAAEELDRPHQYLASSRLRKEDLACEILEENPVDQGLICVFSCVEPCMTYEIHRSREKKKLQLRLFEGKCLHLYHYFLDPKFGFMSARIQTWFPFTVQIVMNGREWLSRQLDRSRIAYKRNANCFRWIEQPEQAQQLMTRQLETNWPKELDRVLHAINPAHPEIFRGDIMNHYWSVHQAEWATDVMFDKPATLAQIYPRLTIHAMTQFSSGDVMRFLGRKVTGYFKGDIVSDFKDRPEGVRVKHRINRNSIKIYDKDGSVLRTETTINNARDIRVFRKKEGDPNGTPSWRNLRKGVADIHRLTDVCQKANERYLDALAAVEDTRTLKDLVHDVCRPTKFKGKPVRALRPWQATDAKLLEFLNRGELVITGFRNRDLTAFLHCQPPGTLEEKRRRTGQSTRLLRILRAHRLIKKIPKTHRYQVTGRGREIITALLAARNASVSALIDAA